MAETTVNIGGLEVTLSLDPRGLERGKQKSQREFRDIERQAQQMTTAITRTIGRLAPWVSAAAGVSVLTRAITNVVTEAGKLDVLHQQTGLSIESLSRLQGAAELANVAFDQFSSGVLAFGRNVSQAASNSLSSSAVAFAQLGLSFRDAQGSVQSLDSLLPQIADRFASMSDGAAKASIATALFGDAGAQLLPLLSRGADGIEELKRRYEELRGPITAEAIEKTKQFQRASAELNVAIEGLAQTLITQYGPGLTKIINGLTDLIGLGKHLSDVRVGKLGDELRETQARIQEMEASVKDPSWWTNWYTGGDRTLKALREQAAALQQELSKALKPTLFEDRPQSKDRTNEDATKAAREAMQQALFDLDLLQERLDGLPNAWNEAFTVNKTTFDDMRAGIDEITQKYRDQITVVQQMTRTKLQLAKQEQDANLQTAQMFGSMLTAVFNKSKTAAIASALINTAVGVTRALRDVPWPLNWVQAGLVAATGAAQIASIRSTSESGGGSVSSPSGSGSGENCEEGGGQQQTLFVQGISPESLLTGGMVRELVQQIIQYQRDGGHVVLVPQ